jgi:hypothetical protein
MEAMLEISVYLSLSQLAKTLSFLLLLMFSLQNFNKRGEQVLPESKRGGGGKGGTEGQG